MSRPAIILTSKFTTPNKEDFSRYVNYMSRKKALEDKGYLTEEEKAEFEKIASGIDDLKFQKENNKVYVKKSDEEITKEAKTILNDDEFDKYIGYMTRKEALAKQPTLTSNEEKELNRINNQLEQFHGAEKKGTSKLLAGVFSIERDEIRLDDLKNVRQKMADGQKNGSVLWQDVVSFDNEFLIQKGILDPKSDTLDETLLKEASREMMDKFVEKENLNNPFWFASIHRNREHIHIHFATVEAENSRKIELIDNEFQPRGKRKLSTLDDMKSTFVNSMIDTGPILDRITRGRNKVRQNIQESYLKSIKEAGFQTLVNDFVKTLPDDRRKWNYGSLNKDQKKAINKIVDVVLNEDQEYCQLKKDIHYYSDTRKDLYGETVRDSKNYEKNKLAEIQKRNANAVLFSIKMMDKKATNFRGKISVKPQDPNNYIQEVLKALERSQKNKQIHSHPIKVRYEKNFRPTLSKRRAKKIEHMFDKNRVSFEKQRALREYERMMDGNASIFEVR